MRVIIAGSRPPVEVREDAKKLEQWYEERYEQLEAVLAKSGMLTLIDTVLCGEAEGWDELGKRWALAQGLEVEILDPSLEADGLIALWDGSSSNTRRLIANCEKAGMELDCIWVELVED